MARTNLPQPPNHDPNGPHQNTSLCALHARSAHHLSLESKIQTAGAIVENGSKMDQKWIKNGSKWFCSCSCHQKRCHASPICVGIGDGAGGAGLETCQRIASMIPASSPSRKSQISKEIQWNTVGATLG